MPYPPYTNLSRGKCLTHIVTEGRAKQKKAILHKEFKRQKDKLEKDKLKNIFNLITIFEKRVTNSVASLKGLNKTKKEYDNSAARLEAQIQALTPKVDSKVLSLEQHWFACLDWAMNQPRSAQIEITGKAFQCAWLGGVFSGIALDKDHFSIRVKETRSDQAPPRMEFVQKGPSS
ncbi:MAG: hypothetical protein HUN05_03060 [Desulfobacter sp.]|nr:MAG: hypothetical protein HUN05_03060 [Desulfobacter sp.]